MLLRVGRHRHATRLYNSSTLVHPASSVRASTTMACFSSPAPSQQSNADVNAGALHEVFKHVTLTRLLKHLRAEKAPFTFVDLFAGAPGHQVTSSGYRGVSNYDALPEHDKGANLLWQAVPGRAHVRMPHEMRLLDPYLRALHSYNPPASPSDRFIANLNFVPRASLIARYMMRDIDSAVLVERDAAIFEPLRETFRRDARFKMFQRDGSDVARSFVPPTTPNGIVWIDPPFETSQDYNKLLDVVNNVVPRWQHGMFVLCYPIRPWKQNVDYEPQYAVYSALAKKGFTNVLGVEMMTPASKMEKFMMQDLSKDLSSASAMPVPGDESWVPSGVFDQPDPTAGLEPNATVESGKQEDANPLMADLAESQAPSLATSEGESDALTALTAPEELRAGAPRMSDEEIDNLKLTQEDMLELSHPFVFSEVNPLTTEKKVYDSIMEEYTPTDAKTNKMRNPGQPTMAGIAAWEKRFEKKESQLTDVESQEKLAFMAGSHENEDLNHFVNIEAESRVAPPKGFTLEDALDVDYSNPCGVVGYGMAIVNAPEILENELLILGTTIGSIEPWRAAEMLNGMPGKGDKTMADIGSSLGIDLSDSSPAGLARMAESIRSFVDSTDEDKDGIDAETLEKLRNCMPDSISSEEQQRQKELDETIRNRKPVMRTFWLNESFADQLPRHAGLEQQEENPTLVPFLFGKGSDPVSISDLEHRRLDVSVLQSNVQGHQEVLTRGRELARRGIDSTALDQVADWRMRMVEDYSNKVPVSQGAPAFEVARMLLKKKDEEEEEEKKKVQEQ